MLYLNKQFITADLNYLYHRYTTLPSSFSSESQSGKTTLSGKYSSGVAGMSHLAR